LTCVKGFPEGLLVYGRYWHAWPFSKLNCFRWTTRCADPATNTTVQIHLGDVFLPQYQGICRATVNTGFAGCAGIGIPVGPKTGIESDSRFGLSNGRLQYHAVAGTAVAEEFNLLPIHGGMNEASFLCLFKDRHGLVFVDLSTHFSVDYKLGPHTKLHANIVWFSTVIVFIDQLCLVAAETSAHCQRIVFFNIRLHLVIGMDLISGLNYPIDSDDSVRREGYFLRPPVFIYSRLVGVDKPGELLSLSVLVPLINWNSNIPGTNGGAP